MHLAEPRTSGARGPRPAAQSARESGPPQLRSLQGALLLPIAGGELVCANLPELGGLQGEQRVPGALGSRWLPGAFLLGHPRSVTALRAVAGVSAGVFVGEMATVN